MEEKHAMIDSIIERAETVVDKEKMEAKHAMIDSIIERAETVVNE